MFYYIDTINQFQNIDFSFRLTESDIKSSEQINLKRTTNPNQNPYKTIKN